MTLDGKHPEIKTIQFGKFTGILFPDIYYEFVSELHNFHPDLVRAMTLAKVKLTDGSARDFLNLTFGTDVPASASMHDGFTTFYYKLKQRAATNSSQNALNKIVNENFTVDEKGVFNYRAPEEIGKPLFPSWDEQIDRGDK